MTIYKFRVMYEEDDSIFRDIEIKPSQSLIDFESVIFSSYNLPVTSTGQFFKSNDNWQKLKQLNAAAVAVEEKGKAKAKAHSIPILVAYIDDPHQKFIYEYHGSQEFVFLIELISLNGSEKSTIMYPACVRQQGPSPFKKEDLVAHYTRGAAEEEEEEQAIDDEEDDLDAMNLEGATEEEEEIGSEPEVDETPVDLEEETAEEPEAEFVEEEAEAEAEELGEEELGEDFGTEEDEFR